MQVVTQQLSPSPFFTRTPLFVLTQMHTCGEEGRGGGGVREPTSVRARACAHPHGGGETKYIEGKGLSKTKKARDSAPRTAPVCKTGEETLQAYKQRGFFGGGRGEVLGMWGVKGGGVRPSHIEAVHPHRRVSSRPNCNTPFKKEKKEKSRLN